MSRTGTKLCIAYLAITAICVAIAFYALSMGDSKGWFVFLQLPIAIQSSLLAQLGLAPMLGEIGWIAAYVLIGGPTIFALYLTGWLLEKYFSWAFRSLN